MLRVKSDKSTQRTNLIARFLVLTKRSAASGNENVLKYVSLSLRINRLSDAKKINGEENWDAQELDLILRVRNSCLKFGRLVFTSDGVVVGVAIRRVEPYDLAKIKPTESEAEH